MEKLFQEFSHSFFSKNSIFIELGKQVSDNSFFITGGSGLFGKWILSYFDWLIKKRIAEPRVTVLNRRVETSIHKPYIDNIMGDIKNFSAHEKKYDFLIHLAAPSALDTFNGMEDLDKINQLFLGSQNIINFAKTNILKRCLMTSSGSIYGGFPLGYNELITEKCRISPLSTENATGLAIGKKISETLFAISGKKGDIDVSVARCFSFVGPGLPSDIHYAIGNFVNNIINQNNIKIIGDGKPIRSYMYLGDMVYWLLKILFEGKNYRDYNVGSEHGISMKDLALLIIDLLKSSNRVEMLGLKSKEIGNPPNYFYVPSIKRIKQELKLFQITSLNDAVKNYASYLIQAK